MLRYVRWAAAVAAGLLVAGCSSGSSGGGQDEGKASAGQPSAATSSATGSAALPASLTSQKLDWGRCKATSDSAAPGDEWRCATLRVPLDWSNPDGQTIGLALIRAQASGGSGKRIGSLLFNFGGPGGSGISTMPYFASTVSALRERVRRVCGEPRGGGGRVGSRGRAAPGARARDGWGGALCGPMPGPSSHT
ncbi:alpha/beta hydrolase, partial [Streptomyces sp. NPDC059627]